MAATVDQPKPQTSELGTELPFQIPNWGFARNLGLGNYLDRRETVPELRWPNSVRLGGAFQRMGTDTQLSGLMRGTTLPIRRYVWGIDPNGAPKAAVDGVCRTYNVELIDDAWDAFQTGISRPIPRARNEIVFDQHLADVLKAPRYGHFFFEHWGPVVDELWHPQELAARPPWSVTGIVIDDKGKLVEIRQQQWPQQQPIPARALVTYVNDKDPGDWTGRSMFRSCYREWLAKDELIRIDLVNHANAGGKLIPTAPPGATNEQIRSLHQLSAELRVEGGGAVPDGTGLTFIRATGSDVIASINRHDEAMAREFLMMFMALGTSSSGGNRALASSFIDWFAISQESIAIWARDVFNDQVIRPYVDTNWSDAADYLPRLVFRRPEAANPLDAVANAVTAPAGDPGAIVATDTAQAVAAARLGAPGAIVVDDETRDALLTAHALLERDLGRKPKASRRPRQAKAAAATSPLPLPDRVLRREPTDIEVRAAVDFAAMETNWVSAVDELVATWKTIRAKQVTELHDAIVAADGDLAALASIEATAAGADLIAAQLTQMAHTGAAEAVAEASRQGVAAVLPDMGALAAELTARAAGLEQILTRSLSLAAGTRAQRLTGGSLAPTEVAGEVVTYIEGLTDAYLQTQFGGAASAAQNAGRLAAMETNGASNLYASELLDTNTCEPCAEVDGKEYASFDDAASDYPAGGFIDCEGGERCRGAVVAVYDEAAPSA